MQGVARAGNPGFAKAQEERANSLANASAGAMERARKGTREDIEANQQIDAMDPESTMSKLYQKSFMPIFQKMGYKPEAIAQMPASKIQTLATLGIQFEDAQSQQELKKAMLGVQGMTAKANILNQVAQRTKDTKDTQRAAASEVLKHSGNARVLGIPIPFTSDVSGAEQDAARKVLAEQMEGGVEHPQASEAEAWAKANPNDPRSAEILKRIGK